jgi:hypothetical protein
VKPASRNESVRALSFRIYGACSHLTHLYMLTSPAVSPLTDHHRAASQACTVMTEH